MKIKLGSQAEDKLTGFKGTVTGTAQYLTGCSQYCLLPKTDDPTKYPEGQWFDEGRIVKVKGDSISKKEVKGERNGCDMPQPNKK
jgi:hypothetical protein